MAEVDTPLIMRAEADLGPGEGGGGGREGGSPKGRYIYDGVLLLRLWSVCGWVNLPGPKFFSFTDVHTISLPQNRNS